MSNKQIKKDALFYLRSSWSQAILLTFFAAAELLCYAFFEVIIYILLKNSGENYSFSLSYIRTSSFGKLMTLVRLIFLLGLFLPTVFLIRRSFADICTGGSIFRTKRYISSNLRRLYPHSFAVSAVLFMLKFFAAVPGLIGCYLIYYWGWECRLEDLTSTGLFCFMLSVGFTIVWTCVFIHYVISLSLTNYIMLLNPRGNVFDACDLSVRLMEGKHMRYISFVLSFVGFVPFFVLIYPIFMVAPYFQTAHVIFAKDIMGKYWQDKFPGMIKRWEKHRLAVKD